MGDAHIVMPERALIVRSPWAEMIASGQKTWEMRRRDTAIRGPIGIIKGGSGTVIAIANVTASRGPLDGPTLKANRCFHHSALSPDELARQWGYAWVLADTKALAKPCTYQHPSGAVIWVDLKKAGLAGRSFPLA